MADFKKQVIGTAIGLLIFAILVISLLLYNGSSKDTWPPVVSECPDYWIDKVDKDGNSKKCFNIHNLGKSSCEKTMDFSTNPWSGSTGDCRKYKWSKSCRLTWDGITNNSSICDNSDSDSDSD
jgi:hypothetical protein